MLIGYFDYTVISFLIFLNFRFWKSNIENKVGCFSGILLFGFALPFISMLVELAIVDEWIDNFEVVYTYLKFPAYWLIGILQYIVLGIKLSTKPDDFNEN